LASRFRWPHCGRVQKQYTETGFSFFDRGEFTEKADANKEVPSRGFNGPVHYVETRGERGALLQETDSGGTETQPGHDLKREFLEESWNRQIAQRWCVGGGQAYCRKKNVGGGERC